MFVLFAYGMLHIDSVVSRLKGFCSTIDVKRTREFKKETTYYLEFCMFQLALLSYSEAFYAMNNLGYDQEVSCMTICYVWSYMCLFAIPHILSSLYVHMSEVMVGRGGDHFPSSSVEKETA